MAHSAVSAKLEKYGRVQFMIRSRLYKGLMSKSMSIGPLADDDRLKMVLPQACCYCGSRESLSVDHLISTKKRGKNCGDNLVWACRSCNSSKSARDVLEWLAVRGKFPPLLLLRRYLKLAIEYCQERELMDVQISEAPDLPFSLSLVPLNFPPPLELELWIVSIV